MSEWLSPVTEGQESDTPGGGAPPPLAAAPLPHRAQPFCQSCDSHVTETSQASSPSGLSGDHLLGHQPDFTAKKI